MFLWFQIVNYLKWLLTIHICIEIITIVIHIHVHICISVEIDTAIILHLFKFLNLSLLTPYQIFLSLQLILDSFNFLWHLWFLLPQYKTLLFKRHIDAALPWQYWPIHLHISRWSKTNRRPILLLVVVHWRLSFYICARILICHISLLIISA